MNEESEKIYNKILVLFTTIIVLFVSFVCFIFIGIAKVNAQEIGRIFYGGVQQGATFNFGDADDVAQWTNTNANTIRYDNNNLIMTSGTTYTFSARFTILLQDNIDTVSTIQARPGYSRNGSITDFKDTTCNIDYNSKLLSTTTTKKTVEHYIIINCSDISFSTGNNSVVVRFSVSNSGYYYNIIEMSRTGLIYKDNTSLTESDKIIISQNQNAQDIINNQNQNTQDIIDSITDSSNQTNESLDNIEDALLDSNTSSSSDSLDNFFGSFNNSDNGGLSAIITAPLVAINKTLDNSCPSLDGSYKGKSFSIPSGCVFWNRIPQVKEVANIISGGFLCYLILRKMFLLIHQLKDPTDDRVEVMNL